jgi:type I restriction enzyme S subunit
MKKMTLKGFANVKMGQSPSSETINKLGKGLNFLQGNRTFGEKYPIYDIYSEKSIKVAARGDVLFSVRAPVGDINITTRDVGIGRGLCAIRMKNNNQEFLYYLLKSCSKKINKSSGGTTYNSITIKELEKIEFILPDESEQKYIASILSSLDNKIETNNEINRKLEELAQTLYQQWFVAFEFPTEEGKSYKSSGGEMVVSELGMIPKGWRVTSLETACDRFATGLNPRKNFVLGQGENFYVTIKNIATNSLVLDDSCDKVDDKAILKINNRSDLQKGDILFSGVATIGKVYLLQETPKNWNINESIFTIRPNANISSEFLCLLLLSNQFQSYAKNVAMGSVQKGVRMADLKKYNLVIPSEEILKKFNDTSAPILKMEHSTYEENSKLIELRDTLLPYLMSGKIKIK